MKLKTTNLRKELPRIKKEYPSFYKKLNSKYIYSELAIDYWFEYYGKDYTDNSILLLDNDIPLIAVYLFRKDDSLSFFSRPLEIIENNLTSDSRNKAYNFLFKAIENLKAKDALFYDNPHVSGKYMEKINNSSILRNGIVDLSLGEAEILSSVRKSYRSYINWGKKNLEIKVLDSQTVTNSLFESLRLFHIKVSGRETRSLKSWQLQMEMIQNGNGIIVLGYLDDELVTSCMSLFGNELAYYELSVNRRDLMANKKPISHYCMLKTIYEVRNRGLLLFDLGSVDPHYGNKKDKAIAKFKKGFTNVVHQKIVNHIIFNQI